MVSSYQKDTDEYEEALQRLKNFTYAYGKGEEDEKEEMKMSMHRSSYHTCKDEEEIVPEETYGPKSGH
jgi:hypothetical protein